MPRPNHRAAGLLAAAAIAGVLSSCTAPSDDGFPGAAGTTTASPTPGATSSAESPAPSPTPTAAPTPASSARAADNLPVPVRPDLADEESPEGLEAFTAHWLALLSYSYESNDLEPLLALSDPSCGFCAETGESMAQIYRTAWASGGATTLTGFSTDFSADAAGTYAADVTTTQNEIFYYSAEGWLGSSESVPDTPHILTARYDDGRWQLIEYATPPAG